MWLRPLKLFNYQKNKNTLYMSEFNVDFTIEIGVAEIWSNDQTWWYYVILDVFWIVRKLGFGWFIDFKEVAYDS